MLSIWNLYRLIVGDIVVYNLRKFQIDSLHIEISTNFLSLQKFLLILDWLGLNFDAINLKFLQILDNILDYNLWKFQIDSLQIEIRMNFVSPPKFFHILDQLGLNFDAINLKFLKIVGYIVVYNL